MVVKKPRAESMRGTGRAFIASVPDAEPARRQRRVETQLTLPIVPKLLELIDQVARRNNIDRAAVVAVWRNDPSAVSCMSGIPIPPHTLSARALLLLRLLVECERLTASAAAPLIGLSVPQAWRLAHSLVKRGYASRSLDPNDRRTVPFSPTVVGMALAMWPGEKRPGHRHPGARSGVAVAALETGELVKDAEINWPYVAEEINHAGRT